MSPKVPASAVSLVYFVSGASLAVVTCGGILEERLSAGDPDVGLVANFFVTAASVLLLGLVQHRKRLAPPLLARQALGAAVGIVAVHLALRLGLVTAPRWLSERPPQFVNDVVAVFSALTLVWACARGLNVRLLVAALLVLTAYRATGRLWHLDAAPRGFVVPVQDFVLAQFVAAALALLVYRGMTRREA
ncbi:MAG TPA: hypothetical protein VMI75_37620 [Polyangiaceae bacterium]|nr:hypothetical protein [Polyangiaceae bacterium]